MNIFTIKQKAIDENIPIIMDDTLKLIERILIEEKPKRILELGTATRLFFNMFFKHFKQ